jgi:tRNA U34 5-carboxymethylaminomethyl modifying enzyme MnmG/GidA
MNSRIYPAQCTECAAQNHERLSPCNLSFLQAVVLTTGTFMNGRIWVGRASMAAGRAGEAPSTGLTEMLVGLGFETDRLKTGTPARVDSRTVNFKGLEEQPGENIAEDHQVNAL